MVHRSRRFNILFPFIGGLLCGTLLVFAQEDTGRRSTGLSENPKVKPEDEIFQKEAREELWQDVVDSKDISRDQEKIPDWQARWELARLLGYQGKYTEALREYRKVLNEKPDKTKIKIEMAHLYYYKGDPEKAQQLLSEVNERETQDLPPAEMIILGKILTAAKKYDQAIDIYKTIIDKHGPRPQVRYNLARVLSWSQKYEESLEQYRKILEKRPADRNVRRHYAQVLKWAGKHEKAAEQYRKSLEDTNNSE